MAGCVEREPVRVQAVAEIAGKPRLGQRKAARRVERVADERMARGGQVDADLVRAPGVDRHVDEGVASARGQDGTWRARPAVGARRVDPAQPRMRTRPMGASTVKASRSGTPGRARGRPSRRRRAPGGRHRRARLRGEAEQQQARRAPSQPVHRRGRGREAAHDVQQRVGQERRRSGWWEARAASRPPVGARPGAAPRTRAGRAPPPRAAGARRGSGPPAGAPRASWGRRPAGPPRPRCARARRSRPSGGSGGSGRRAPSRRGRGRPPARDSRSLRSLRQSTACYARRFAMISFPASASSTAGRSCSSTPRSSSIPATRSGSWARTAPERPRSSA